MAEAVIATGCEAIYTGGMLRALPRPVPITTEHGLLGQPRCTDCGRPYNPEINDNARNPTLAATGDDFMDGFRPPYCQRCRLAFRMRCDLLAGRTYLED